MATVAVLMPAYNEGDSLAHAAAAAVAPIRAAGHDARLILIDDGSSDHTWPVIEALARSGDVVGLSLSRNFGKEAALLAGLDHCDADCDIVMDSDGQHPPDVVPRMLALWQSGCQVVHGVKRDRGGEPWLRRLCSRLVFAAARISSGLRLQDSSDFKLLDREVVSCLRRFPERNLFFRGLVEWAGYRTGRVEFDVAERIAGAGKWGAWGLLTYAVNAVISYSARPLRVVSVLALLSMLGSTLIACKTLFDWATGRTAEGFPTVILLLVAYGNVLMAAVSVMSWYVGKIFEEVKMRPRYVVARRAGHPSP